MCDILTRKDVSKEFKLPLGTVDYLVCTKQIPYSRLGRRGVRFSKKRLMEWFREREGVEFRKKKLGTTRITNNI
jgi:hypothetical protein